MRNCQNLISVKIGGNINCKMPRDLFVGSKKVNVGISLGSLLLFSELTEGNNSLGDIVGIWKGRVFNQIHLKYNQ